MPTGYEGPPPTKGRVMRHRVLRLDPERSDRLVVWLRSRLLRTTFVKRGLDGDFIAVPIEQYARARWLLAQMRDH